MLNTVVVSPMPMVRASTATAVSAGRLLNVVCVAEERAWQRESWTDRADVAEVRAAFRGWHPLVGDLIDALDSPLKWALFDRDPLPSWGRGAVTLLGDACHPMLPYGAQGYAQAVEDAAVLTSCLAQDAGNDVATALARYASLRRDRVARVRTWVRRARVSPTPRRMRPRS